MTTTDTPKLYVGTYAKYNNGSIKGAWLDLTDYADADEFYAACAKLHADEADPEYMFQDFECFPEAMYSESSLDPRLFEYAALDEDERLTVDEYIDATGQVPSNFEHACDAFQVELTESNREREYGYYMAEQLDIFQDANDTLSNYFDYEAFGRDCLMDCSVSSNGYVFTDY